VALAPPGHAEKRQRISSQEIGTIRMGDGYSCNAQTWSCIMLKGGLLWLIGIPIPIIILLMIFVF
jgi:hypothetical protein